MKEEGVAEQKHLIFLMTCKKLYETLGSDYFSNSCRI